KEVLAWGAGATLIVRIRWMGPGILREWEEAKRRGEDLKDFDQYRHKCAWWKIKDAAYEDGRDDITTVKLLRDSQRKPRNSESVIIGRATGDLIMVKMKHDDQYSWEKEVHFTHSSPSVRFACISSGPNPVFAACLGDSTIAVYHVRNDRKVLEPTGIVQVFTPEKSCRIWSLVFLSHNRLAVGLGPSMTPIRIYEIGFHEISSQPVRALDLGAKNHTVYSLAPLPHSIRTPGTQGELFLSGDYDGVVRLHDLSLSSAIVASFSDPVDSISAIYTLLPLGHGRFLAGSANYSILKVFDINETLDRLETARNEGTDISPSTITFRKAFNVFLANKDQGPSPGYRVAGRESSSSVYSLSSPSLASPTIFAGIEGKVIQIDVASTLDPFPDPVFNFVGCARSGNKIMHNPLRWDPRGEVICLAMYEQTKGTVRLKKQVPVGKLGYGEMGFLDTSWVMLDAHQKFVLLPQERIHFTSPSRTTLSLTSPNSYPGKEPLSITSSSGVAYVTNQRVVYLPANPTLSLQSFSAPLLNLQDTHVSAPFFGANAWSGILNPVSGGGIPSHHLYVKISMTFKDGGAFDFANTYERIKETVSQAMEMARESGDGRVNPEDVNLEQLPAYEEVGSTFVAAQPAAGLRQPVPVAPPPPSQMVAAPQRAGEEGGARPQGQSVEERQYPPPDGPPPGYEEVQQESVAESLERNLRIGR
ncbi:MAG: hypothetical protein Q9174_005929, partial [Haloplaca sp. 1 TL-2023]